MWLWVKRLINLRQASAQTLKISITSTIMLVLALMTSIHSQENIVVNGKARLLKRCFYGAKKFRMMRLILSGQHPIFLKKWSPMSHSNQLSSKSITNKVLLSLQLEWIFQMDIPLQHLRMNIGNSTRTIKLSPLIQIYRSEKFQLMMVNIG